MALRAERAREAAAKKAARASARAEAKQKKDEEKELKKERQAAEKAARDAARAKKKMKTGEDDLEVSERWIKDKRMRCWDMQLVCCLDWLNITPRSDNQRSPRTKAPKVTWTEEASHFVIKQILSGKQVEGYVDLDVLESWVNDKRIKCAEDKQPVRNPKTKAAKALWTEQASHFVMKELYKPANISGLADADILYGVWIRSRAANTLNKESADWAKPTCFTWKQVQSRWVKITGLFDRFWRSANAVRRSGTGRSGWAGGGINGGLTRPVSVSQRIWDLRIRKGRHIRQLNCSGLLVNENTVDPMEQRILALGKRRKSDREEEEFEEEEDGIEDDEPEHEVSAMLEGPQSDAMDADDHDDQATFDMQYELNNGRGRDADKSREQERGEDALPSGGDEDNGGGGGRKRDQDRRYDDDE
eukprot:1497460-Rhodomonas_salina.1